MTKPTKDHPCDPGKKRIRRPSVTNVLAQVRRAGVVEGSVQFMPDGSFIVVLGGEKSTPAEGQDIASDDWDVL